MCKTSHSQKQTKAYEVADIFRLYGDEYIKKHPLALHYLKVIHDITVCRTKHLGGHIYQCSYCGYETEVYNSCRNRHCPKCQFTARVKWVEKRKSEIIPVSYFHNVFTLPHTLNPLILRNKNVCLNLLFKAVSETLLEFGKGELNGKPGFIAILHTWTQTLMDHFHLHCVIPAGAISEDKKKWINSKDDFLFSVIAMSKKFRGKYIEYLIKAYENDELIFPGKIKYLSEKNEFKRYIDLLWETEWVVYSKKPFSSPEKVLEYLSRYTHRVAIANHRIVSVENGSVTFNYKDRKNGNIDKQLTLSVDEFIRRFLLHVLPGKFMKIRYYGFLGNRNRKENVCLCRELLGAASVEFTQKNTLELIKEVIGVDITRCPHCKKGQMQAVGKIMSFVEKLTYCNTS